MNLAQVKAALKPPSYFFDLRNIYKREDVEAAGMIYNGTGK